MIHRLFLLSLCLVAAAGSAGDPAARSDMGFVRDADGALLLYGGYGVQGARPDTAAIVWRRDSTGWTAVLPVAGAPSPGVRADAVVAYDSAARRLLVVGGRDGAADHGDVWGWQNGAWAPVAPASPGARHLAAGAFDLRRGELVLYGGHELARGQFRTDTWVLRGSSWRRADSVSNGPDVSFAMGMTWDPTRGTVVMHGGHAADGAARTDTWSWDGSRWTRIATGGPGLTAINALVADPLGRGILLIASPGDPVREPLQTWLLEGATWRQLTAGGPSPRGGHGLVADVARKRVLLFGGQEHPRAKFNDVWAFDGREWSRVAGVG